MGYEGCKIVCNGKEVATISCTENGINIKSTEEGKKFWGRILYVGKRI